jgi:tetratricopeptide (TPR) repeat protein
MGRLGGAGVALSWSRRRELWLLYAWLLVFAAAVTAFFVFARYRFPLVPVLMIFAGAGVVEGVERICARRWRSLGAAAGVALACALVMNWPIFDANKQRAMAHYNLGTALKDREQYEAAIEQYRVSLSADPTQSTTYNNLGNALQIVGRPDEAHEAYRESVRLQPANGAAQFSLGMSYLRRGDFEAALRHLRESQRHDPEYPEVYVQQTMCLLQTDRFAEAIAVLREGLRVLPGDVQLMNALAQLLATAPDAADRDGAEAVRLAESACWATEFGDARTMSTLAAAYAEAGRFEEAVRAGRRALEIARLGGEAQLAAIIEHHLRLFESGRAFHIEPAPGRSP